MSELYPILRALKMGEGSGGGGGSGGGSGNLGDDEPSSTPNLNLKSVLDAGLGPASATKIASAVKSGQYSLTVKNGEAYVTKNNKSSNPHTVVSNPTKAQELLKGLYKRTLGKNGF